MERFDRRTRERVSKALEGLVAVPPRSNLDVRPLMGHTIAAISTERWTR